MNLSEARAALASRGFDYLEQASMNLMLNRARNDFEDHYEWPWLAATAAGPAPLDLPDLKYVKKVTDADGNPLWGLTTENRLTIGADTSRYWWLTDAPDEHVLVNANGSDITVDYIRQSPELTADTATPIIPVRYHAVWIDWAVVQAYKDSDNFPAAQALQTDINARMQFLVERYETRNRMHSPFITVLDPSEDE